MTTPQEEENTIGIEVPQPLTSDNFRKKMIESMKEDPELVENLSDDDIYNQGVAIMFCDISQACVNSNGDELGEMLMHYGFYTDKELESLSILEVNTQDDVFSNMLFNRFSQVEDVQPIMAFYDCYKRMEIAKDSLQLAKSLNRIEKFLPALPDDIAADIYYNASLLYHDFASRNKFENHEVMGQELFMIERALELTSNPDTIEACEQRLVPPQNRENLTTRERTQLSSIKKAYKNALSRTEDVDALYKLHLNLGNVYYDLSKVPGYRHPQSESVKNIKKAITQYQEALPLSEDQGKKRNVLEKLAAAHKTIGDMDEWAVIRCEIAQLIPSAQYRYSYLIGTAEELGHKSYSNSAKSILNATIKAIKKDNVLDRETKSRLQIRAYTSLRDNNENPEETAKYNKQLLLLQKNRINVQ